MSKKSILLGLSIFMAIFLSLTVVKVSANPPSNMSLSYNSGTEQLNVTITHITGGTPGHYIDNVTISVNGIMVHSQTYSSQPNPTTFTDQYLNIVADVGDTINVWARCSLTADTITRQLVVTSSNGITTPNDAIPGYPGIWLILTACIGLIGTLIYKKIRKGNYGWA